MKRLRGAALAALVILSLAACNHDPGSGTIERKAYSAGYTWYSSQCVAYGTQRVGNVTSSYCISSILIPYYVPAEWQLYLRKDSDHVGWHDVTQSEYARWSVGQFYR